MKNGHPQKDHKMFFKTDYHYRLMQVKSIAECSKEHSAILLTFIKLPVVIKTFILSIFEEPFYAGFIFIFQKEDSGESQGVSRVMALDLIQNFISVQYLENKLTEFHQIL